MAMRDHTPRASATTTTPQFVRHNGFGARADRRRRPLDSACGRDRNAALAEGVRSSKTRPACDGRTPKGPAATADRAVGRMRHARLNSRDGPAPGSRPALSPSRPSAGPAPDAPRASSRARFGDWQMRCETPAGAKNEQCALVQNVAAEDRPNVTLLVIVLKTADGKSRLLRVVAPLGVLLPAGPRAQDRPGRCRPRRLRALPDHGLRRRGRDGGHPDRPAQEAARPRRSSSSRRRRRASASRCR